MRIIFVGSQDYGAKCLEFLLKNNQDVIAVFTFEPDVHETWQNDFKTLLKGRKETEIIITKNLRNHAKAIKAMKPDVIFVIGWRTLIPKEIFSLPKRGCIGIHGSLLPKYRGFAPLNWALINGENEIGVSMFYIGDGVDTGDIIAQKIMRVKSNEDMESIKARFDDLIIKIFKEQYPKIKAGKASRRKQDHAEATYGCMRTPEDGEINWAEPAESVFNFIRALGRPFPGAFTHIGDKKIYIWKARLLQNRVKHYGRPGSIVRMHEDGVEVLTKDGSILLEIIQPEGSAEIKAIDYIKSIKVRFDFAHMTEINKIKGENKELKKIMEKKK